jgi:hypothetical protein
MKRIVVQSALAFSTAMALSGAALAQDEPAPATAEPAPAPAPATAEASGSASLGGGASGGGGMTLPGAAPAAAAPGESSHDQMIGRLAVGYLGAREVPVGLTDGGVLGQQFVNAPVIGVRYWLDEMLGIDVGLGVHISSSGSEVTTAAGSADADGPSTTAFLLHGGVPLSLASTGNFSFQIVPEMNVGFASRSIDDADLKGSGFRFDIGARAGAEVHFGFIGIPELSLQGSVGLGLALNSWKGEDDADGAAIESSEGSSMVLATSVQNDPWDIFTSSVSALYYF